MHISYSVIYIYIILYIYTHYISYIHYIIHICRLDASVPSNSQLTHISRHWTPICTKKSSYDELWISHLISPRICVICGSWGSFIILLTTILTFGSHMMVTGLVLTQMNGGTPKAKNSRHPKRNKKITASLHVSMGQYWAIISKIRLLIQLIQLIHIPVHGLTVILIDYWLFKYEQISM